MWSAVSIVLVSVLAMPGGSLFGDPNFERGFGLSPARHPAEKMELGPLSFPGGPKEPPAWRLAQWASNYLLELGTFQAAGDGKWVAETAGKRVVVNRQGEKAPAILLEVKGGAEFAGRFRKTGEFWPHLLLEQGFVKPIKAEGEGALQLAFDFRIDHCQVAPEMEAGIDPGLHTAQISAYFTVHNAKKSSADYGDMIWFGIPLFDVRYGVPPSHYDVDTAPGGGGKFICSLDGGRFWQGNTGDGQWRGLDVDLRPLLREALQITQAHGCLKQSTPGDLVLTSFNLGWEVPGPYDCAAEIRGLRLQAE